MGAIQIYIFYSSTSNPDSTVSTHNTLLIGLYWHVVHLLGVQIDPPSPASQVDARRVSESSSLVLLSIGTAELSVI